MASNPDDAAITIAASAGMSIDDLHMFIYPEIRKSYTSFRAFSRYRDITAEGQFVLQQAKSARPTRPQYRIVTALNPLYEIARGNDLGIMFNTAWKFIRILQERLEPTLSPKERIAEVIRQASIIGEYNARKNRGYQGSSLGHVQSPSTLSTVSSRMHPLPSGVAAATPATISDGSVGAARRHAEKGHSGAAYAAIANAPFVAEAIIPFEGLTAYVAFFCLTFVPILLLRDATVENFRIALIVFYAITAPLIVFGYPKTLGFTVFGHRANFKNLANHYEALAVVSRRGERRLSTIEDDETTDEEESSEDEEEDGIPQSIKSHSPNAAVENNTTVAPFSPRGLVPLLTVKPAVDCSESNVFSDIHGQSFQVRCGPNYKKNKLKAPSSESLLYLAGVDIYTCKKRVSHLAQYMDLQPLYSRRPTSVVLIDKSPVDKGMQDVRRQVDESFLQSSRQLNLAPNEVFTSPATADGFTLGSMEKPLIFIAVFQLPTYSPGTFTSITDGPGLSVVQYFVATPETQRDLLRQNPRSPAVRLLRDMMLATPGSDESKRQLDRMKCIPRLVNDDELDMPWLVRSAVKSYNAKPFLTRPQHSVFRGPGYFEFDLDVHAFCTAARKVLESFISKFGDVVLDWAYTVEAYDDDEQPECILGGFRLFRCDMVNRPSWEASLEAYLAAKSRGPIPELAPGMLTGSAAGTESPVLAGETDSKIGDADALASLGGERKDASVHVGHLNLASPSDIRTSASTIMSHGLQSVGNHHGTNSGSASARAYTTPMTSTGTHSSRTTVSAIPNSPGNSPRGAPITQPNAAQASYHTHNAVGSR